MAAITLITADACLAETATRGETREWLVGGETRQALIFRPVKGSAEPRASVTPGAPADLAGSPVIFAFHGHGGSMEQAARRFRLHEEWPEAFVVYPQGLRTPGVLTDPEGKRSGWQSRADSEGGRDLAFFDALWASLRAEGRLDERRIYATGHSNGDGFTYLLWAERADVFAAFAPVAASLSRHHPPTTARPVMHIAGKADRLVKFEWQEKTIEFVRNLNGGGAATPWPADASCVLYPSPQGIPVVTRIHAGGHGNPAEAARLIVRFFQEHRRP